MNVIGIIPARGGSKGVPRKNVRALAGKPLILYSIEAAKKSSFINTIIVSTDDDKIAEISEQGGAEIVDRPAALAKDDSLVMDAVRHVLTQKKRAEAKYDLLVLLEPTAPFRQKNDIDDTIQLLIDKNADSAATFSETNTPPGRIWKVENGIPAPFIKDADPFLPRQQQSKGYALNGMVYVLKTNILEQYPEGTSFLLGKSVANIISRDRVVDIDTERDFFIAEQLLKMNHTKI